MKIRPGLQMLRGLVVLTAWSLVCFVWPLLGWLIPVALVAVLIAAGYEFSVLSHSLKQIKVIRSLPSPVARDRAFTVSLRIENNSSHEWSAEIRDEFPNAAIPRIWITPVALPTGTTTVSTSARIPQRGQFTFGPVWLRLYGRWRLLEGQAKFSEPQALHVYPESILSDQELAKDAADELRLLDQLRYSRQKGVGTEFESLEDFRLGDDPRRIDWRSSARLGRQIVRRYQIERHRDVIVLIDCGRLMGADALRGTKLDCAVDATLRLLRLALRGGDRCGLGIFDQEVLGYLRPIGGDRALPTFLECLYDVQSRWRESDFGSIFATLQSRQQKRALVVILSDIVDIETSRRFRLSLLKLAQRHVVLFVALQTPVLRQFIEAPLKTVEDGLRKSVTFRLLRERQIAINELRRGGIQILDLEPAELTAPLINRFIELRGANVL